MGLKHGLEVVHGRNKACTSLRWRPDHRRFGATSNLKARWNTSVGIKITRRNRGSNTGRSKRFISSQVSWQVLGPPSIPFNG